MLNICKTLKLTNVTKPSYYYTSSVIIIIVNIHQQAAPGVPKVQIEKCRAGREQSKNKHVHDDRHSS